MSQPSFLAMRPPVYILVLTSMKWTKPHFLCSFWEMRHPSLHIHLSHNSKIWAVHHLLYDISCVPHHSSLYLDLLTVYHLWSRWIVTYVQFLYRFFYHDKRHTLYFYNCWILQFLVETLPRTAPIETEVGDRDRILSPTSATATN